MIQNEANDASTVTMAYAHQGQPPQMEQNQAVTLPPP